MSTSVVLPALGESVTEGTVTRWLKKVGDTVQADEGLLEISTDKVDTEIPSPVSGVIEEILVAEVQAWERARNRDRARIRWMFTIDRAREKLGRAYPTVPSGRIRKAA